MGLSRYEQETIILFNEEEKTASVYTYNGALKRKLTELCESRPQEARRSKADEHGGITFVIPKRWVKVNPTRILSDAQKAVSSKINGALQVLAAGKHLVNKHPQFGVIALNVNPQLPPVGTRIWFDFKSRE